MSFRHRRLVDQRRLKRCKGFRDDGRIGRAAAQGGEGPIGSFVE
jgi:hypothetical protein